MCLVALRFKSSLGEIYHTHFPREEYPNMLPLSIDQAVGTSIPTGNQKELFTVQSTKVCSQQDSWWEVFWKCTNGPPWWSSGYESTPQCRGHRFNPWSRKISHAAEQLSLWPSVSWNSWARVPWLLKPECPKSSCSATREATSVRSLHAKTGESSRSNEDPAQP